MIDPIMNVWDAAAIQPVLEQAGGAFTDWRGEPTIRGGEGFWNRGVSTIEPKLVLAGGNFECGDIYRVEPR